MHLLDYTALFSTCLLDLALAPVVAVRSRHLRYIAEQTLPDREGNIARRVDHRMTAAFDDPAVQAAWFAADLEYFPVAPLVSEPAFDSERNSRDEALQLTAKLRPKWLRFTGRYLSEQLFLTKLGSKLGRNASTSHSEAHTAWLTVTSLFLTLHARNVAAGEIRYSGWQILSEPPHEDPHVRFVQTLPGGISKPIQAVVPFQRDWGSGKFLTGTISERLDRLNASGERLQVYLPEPEQRRAVNR